MVENYVFQKKWTHADAVESNVDLIRNAVSRKINLPYLIFNLDHLHK